MRRGASVTSGEWLCGATLEGEVSHVNVVLVGWGGLEGEDVWWSWTDALGAHACLVCTCSVTGLS